VSRLSQAVQAGFSDWRHRYHKKMVDIISQKNGLAPQAKGTENAEKILRAFGFTPL